MVIGEVVATLDHLRRERLGRTVVRLYIGRNLTHTDLGPPSFFESSFQLSPMICHGAIRIDGKTTLDTVDQLYRHYEKELGSEALRFLLALDAEDAADPQLTRQQQESLMAIHTILSELPPSPDPHDRQFRMSYLLADYRPNLGSSAATYLRKASGGAPSKIGGEDQCENALVRVASDSYISLILEDQTNFGMPRHTFLSVMRHPDATFIEAQILSGKHPLSPVFEGINRTAESNNAPEHFDLTTAATAHLKTSEGRAGGVQLALLIDSFMSNAVYEPQIGRSSLDTWLTAVLKAYRLAIELAQNGKALVPTRVFLANINLSPGTTGLNFGDGVVRPALNIEKRQLGADSSSDVVWQFPTEIALIRSGVPVDVDGQPSSSRDTMNSARLFHQTVETKIQRFRLALLMASPPGTYAAVSIRSKTTNVTLFSGPMISAPPLRDIFPTFPPFEIEESLLRGAAHYEARIDKFHSALEAGGGRLVSAVSERFDARDAFVDSMICMEAMFGSRGETTFKVAASMANVLHPNDGASRLATYRRLKQLYGRRSDIVHGSDTGGKTNPTKLRDEGIRLALTALCALSDDYAELLPLVSEKRMESILIGDFRSMARPDPFDAAPTDD